MTDATPVKLGVLTATQRAHSKLYVGYNAANKTIPEMMAEAPGDPITFVIYVGFYRLPNRDTSPRAFVSDLSKNANAVIRGTVVAKTSQVTEDATFIFTDYTVRVTEVLKNDGASHIRRGGAITVTRPGGRVILNGVIVSAIDESAPLLNANGSEVVLFLKYLRVSRSYAQSADLGTYAVDRGRLKPITGRTLPPKVSDSLVELLPLIRSVCRATVFD